MSAPAITPILNRFQRILGEGDLEPADDPFFDDSKPLLDLPGDDPFAEAAVAESWEGVSDPDSPLVLAAFYGRVSTDQQDLRTQVAWGERYAAERGFTIPPALRFLDEDRSGRLPLLEREAGRALWNLIHGPGYRFPDGRVLPVKHVLVSVFDRWGRKPDDAVANVEHCHRMGVRVHIADVPLYNPDDPTCLLILRTRGAFAEFEVGLIRKRIRDKFREKRSRGEVCGRLAYGWRLIPGEGGAPDREEPDDLEQGWITHMRRRRSEGWGYNRIARELNAQGVSTKIPAGTILRVRGKRLPDGTEGPAVEKPVTGLWDEGNVRNVLLTADRKAAAYAQLQNTRSA